MAINLLLFICLNLFLDFKGVVISGHKFKNLNATIKVESSLSLGELVFTLTTSNARELTAIRLKTDSKYFELNHADHRRVVVKSCLPAGLTEVLEFSSGDETDNGKLTINVSPVTPIYNIPSGILVPVGSDSSIVDVVVIELKNSGECTSFQCQAVCKNIDKKFWIEKDKPLIRSYTSDIKYNFEYQLEIACVDRGLNKLSSTSYDNPVTVSVTFNIDPASKAKATPADFTNATIEPDSIIFDENADIILINANQDPYGFAGEDTEVAMLDESDRDDDEVLLRRNKRSGPSTVMPAVASNATYTAIKVKPRCFCSSNFPRLGPTGFFIRKFRPVKVAPIVVVTTMAPTSTTVESTVTSETSKVTTEAATTEGKTSTSIPSTLTTTSATTTLTEITSVQTTMPSTPETTASSATTKLTTTATTTTTLPSTTQATSTTVATTKLTTAAATTTLPSTTQATSTTVTTTKLTTAAATTTLPSTTQATSTTVTTTKLTTAAATTTLPSTTQATSTTVTTTKLTTAAATTTLPSTTQATSTTVTTTKLTTAAATTTLPPTTEATSTTVATTKLTTAATTKLTTTPPSTTDATSTTVATTKLTTTAATKQTTTTLPSTTEATSTTVATTPQTTKTTIVPEATTSSTTTSTQAVSTLSTTSGTTKLSTSETTVVTTKASSTSTTSMSLSMSQSTTLMGTSDSISSTTENTQSQQGASSDSQGTTQAQPAPTSPGGLISETPDPGFFDDMTNLISVIGGAGATGLAGFGLILYKCVLQRKCRSPIVGSSVGASNEPGDFSATSGNSLSSSPTATLIANQGSSGLTPVGT